MPDIAMCTGTDSQRSCPRLDSCHRRTALPTPRRQAYMALPLADDGSCSFYWNNSGLRRADGSVNS